ncbi:trypsin-like serine protease [Amycolatopsis sp. lyj-90]|uniref:trypsin-like serine protease n=1 Tax=Amycolatopsis sp. lyj-90 TaxID=2789285 RepID=UPI0039790E0B
MRPRHAVPALVLAALVSTSVPANAISNGTPISGAAGQPYGQTARVEIGNGDRQCSGVLVRPRLLLTAASCLAADPANPGTLTQGAPPMRVMARFGSSADYTLGGSSEPGAYVPVSLIYPRADRDLVVAKLAYRADLSTPARLATTPPAVGDQLTMTGFGRTHQEWVTARQHQAATSVTAVDPTTLGITGPASVCRGDAGGPLYRSTPQGAELVGVHGASWQQGCAGTMQSRNGAVESRVDDLGAWIAGLDQDSNVICAPSTAWNLNLDTSFTPRLNTGTADAPAALAPTSSWGANGTPQPNKLRGIIKTAPGGWIWNVHRRNGTADPMVDGTLRLWRYQNGVLTGGEKVGTYWQHYLTKPQELTVDANGVVYRVGQAGTAQNGQLIKYIWDFTAKKWLKPSGEVVDAGWGARHGTHTVVASGTALYGTLANGTVVRYEYAGAPSGVITPKGWPGDKLVSIGADIVYVLDAVTASRENILWTRYYPDTQTWEPTREVGHTGPIFSSVSPDPATCHRT